MFRFSSLPRPFLKLQNHCWVACMLAVSSFSHSSYGVIHTENLEQIIEESELNNNESTNSFKSIHLFNTGPQTSDFKASMFEKDLSLEPNTPKDHSLVLPDLTNEPSQGYLDTYGSSIDASSYVQPASHQVTIGFCEKARTLLIMFLVIALPPTIAITLLIRSVRRQNRKHHREFLSEEHSWQN